MAGIILRTAALVTAALLLAGCATSGPQVLPIDAAAYGAAFDAATEVARASGMPAAFRDRRTGVIETQPRIVGSVLEPWRDPRDTLARSLPATLAFQRRIARFTFAPVGADEDVTGDPALVSPDMMHMEDPPADLTRHDGPLELRVRVFVEQAERSPPRRSTWTRRAGTNTRLDERTDPVRWEPVTRDPRLERELLARIARAIGSTGGDPGAEGDEG